MTEKKVSSLKVPSEKQNLLKNICNQINSIRHGRQPMTNLFLVKKKISKIINSM